MIRWLYRKACCALGKHELRTVSCITWGGKTHIKERCVHCPAIALTIEDLA
jgi:hypothetical protein